MSDHQVIYKTNFPHEILLVQNTLKDLNIPHYGQEQSVTGLREAMPLSPVSSPGRVWAILVPDIAVNDALEAIANLGLVERDEREIWGSGPAEPHPTIRYIYLFILFVFFASAAFQIWVYLT